MLRDRVEYADVMRAAESGVWHVPAPAAVSIVLIGATGTKGPKVMREAALAGAETAG
jgi:hypothetical protein